MNRFAHRLLQWLLLAQLLFIACDPAQALTRPGNQPSTFSLVPSKLSPIGPAIPESHPESVVWGHAYAIRYAYDRNRQVLYSDDGEAMPETIENQALPPQKTQTRAESSANQVRRVFQASYPYDADEVAIGNNEDPLSLHKYLYCKANPVNGWDPLGFSDNMEFGNRVQEVITDDFTSKGNFRDGNRAIGTLVGQKSKGILAIRPDLYQNDGKNNFFFEIKSATPDQIRIGTRKVALYNSILNGYDSWRPGTASDYIYAPNGNPVITTRRGGMPLPGGAIAIVLPPVGGLMTYIKINGNVPKYILDFIAVDVMMLSEVASTGELAVELAEIEQLTTTATALGQSATTTIYVSGAAVADIENGEATATLTGFSTGGF